MNVPGHEKTIAKLALDGKTTAEAAALQLVNLEQEKRETTRAARQADSDNMPKIQPGADDADANAAEEAALINAAADAGTAV